MNAPKYLRILKAANVKFIICGDSVIIDNEDGTYLNITDYTEKQFYNFLGY